jgi:hypothetical protein
VSSVLWHCCQRNQACWLEPFVTRGARGALGPAYTGVLVSLVLQSEGSRSCIRGEHGALSLCVCQTAGLTLSSGAWSCDVILGVGDWSVELLVFLPILPLVSCFSICRFREGFASCWLGDPMGAFWGTDLPFLR